MLFRREQDHRTDGQSERLNQVREGAVFRRVDRANIVHEARVLNVSDIEAAGGVCHVTYLAKTTRSAAGGAEATDQRVLCMSSFLKLYPEI